jgi:hypothetical protein
MQERPLVEETERIITMPLYAGMSVREAWQHTLDAGLEGEVPEFARANALGTAYAWVNIRTRGDELLGVYPVAGGEADPDTLDETWQP